MLTAWFTVTPTTCKALIDAGYDLTVERSTQRIFDGMSPFSLDFERLRSTNPLLRRGIRQGLSIFLRLSPLNTMVEI